MQIGDILFLKNNSLLAKLIKSYDHGNYSHCMMVVGVDSDNSNNPIQVIEAQWNTRVRICDLYTDDYDVVSLNLTDNQKNKLIQIAPQFLGSVYDWKKILWFICNKYLGVDLKFLDNKHRYICSELCETILYMLSIIPSEEIGKHTPNSLFTYLNQLEK